MKKKEKMAYVPSTLVLAKFCIVPHQRSRSAVRNKSIILQNEMLSYVTTTAVLVTVVTLLTCVLVLELIFVQSTVLYSSILSDK